MQFLLTLLTRTCNDDENYWSAEKTDSRERHFAQTSKKGSNTESKKERKKVLLSPLHVRLLFQSCCYCSTPTTVLKKKGKLTYLTRPCVSYIASHVIEFKLSMSSFSTRSLSTDNKLSAWLLKTNPPFQETLSHPCIESAWLLLSEPELDVFCLFGQQWKYANDTFLSSIGKKRLLYSVYWTSEEEAKRRLKKTRLSSSEWEKYTGTNNHSLCYVLHEFDTFSSKIFSRKTFSATAPREDRRYTRPSFSRKHIMTRDDWQSQVMTGMVMRIVSQEVSFNRRMDDYCAACLSNAMTVILFCVEYLLASLSL